MERAAVIVAGGKGLRMGGQTRKQYLGLGGIPILVRTLDVFLSSPEIDRVVLVAPAADISWIQDEMLSRLSSGDRVEIAEGGVERQDSVQAGLLALGSEFTGVVAVHDGVRPFVTHSDISRCLKAASECGAAIVGVPAFETVKRVTEGRIDETLSREGLWMAQTPQAFDVNLLRKAHQKAELSGFQGTDDASLVEHLGESVRMIQGSRSNIKITTPQDLAFAEAFLPAFPIHSSFTHFC